jgi:hypothetical protein
LGPAGCERAENEQHYPADEDQLGAAHELLLRTPQGQPNRWVVQYNFYINDRQWARMFVRICPYLPFSARVCLNQHHWLANRMREGGSPSSNVPMPSLPVGVEEADHALRLLERLNQPVQQDAIKATVTAITPELSNQPTAFFRSNANFVRVYVVAAIQLTSALHELVPRLNRYEVALPFSLCEEITPRMIIFYSVEYIEELLA